jgi:polysaccharide biosynthesis protein PslH
MPRILFLAHRIPFPPDRGDKIRSFHILRALAKIAAVDLACFADDDADAAHLDGLRAALGGRLGAAHVEVRHTSRASAAWRALTSGLPLSLTVFDSPAMPAFVRQRLPQADAVYVFSGQMAQFVPMAAAQRFIMDFVDVDSAKFAEYAAESRGPMRVVYGREARLLSRFEHEAAARADVSLFVSEAEARLFRQAAAGADVRALGNGIDTGFFNPEGDFPRLSPDQRGEGPLLLFTGQMDYRPNADAVSWFAREVLPLVPGARFAIAGRNPSRAVQALAGPRVTVTGAVPDMRSWLAAADVVVAPLRIARGVQNKVLEAMSMARPVVASPAAFEGIEAEPGRHLFVEHGAAAMAASVKRLLADRAAAEDLGNAARAHVVASYSWEARLATLQDLLLPGLSAPITPNPAREPVTS